MRTLETERLRMRPIDLCDVAGVFTIYSSPKVCDSFDLLPFQHVSQAERHVERWVRLAGENKQFRHAILFEEELVGTCGLYSVSTHHRRASLGCDLLPAHWNKGLMTEALTAYLPYCFVEHELSRIQGLVLPSNGASISLLQKLEFQHEGLLRKYEYWEGNGLVDLAMYALLRS